MTPWKGAKKAGWKEGVYAALSWHGLSDSGVPSTAVGDQPETGDEGGR